MRGGLTGGVEDPTADSVSLSLARSPWLLCVCDLVIFPLSGGGQETNKKKELLSTRFCASFVQGRPMQHTHNKNPQKFVAPLARSCLFCTDRRAIRRLTDTTTTHTKPQVLVPVSAAVDPLNRPPTPKKRREGRKKVVVVVVVVGRAVRPARLSLSPLTCPVRHQLVGQNKRHTRR